MTIRATFIIWCDVFDCKTGLHHDQLLTEEEVIKDMEANMGWKVTKKKKCICPYCLEKVER